MKAWAEFAGLQEIPDTNPVQHIRLYHIRGDHPLTGSTVTVWGLVRNKIDIPDLTPEQFEKEMLLLAELYLDDSAVDSPVSEYAKTEILKSMSFRIVPMDEAQP